MRKSILAAVLAVVMILALCAGCGSKTADPVQVSENFTAPTPIPAEETPAPTEEPAEETLVPEDTTEPAETEQPGDAQPAETAANNDLSGNNGNSGNNSNSGGNSAPAPVTPEPEPDPTPVQDKRSVAMDLIGSGVDSLYAAIGSPNSTSYTASCLVLGGEDGFLYYDGFTVETIRRADGSELIYDVF